MSFLLQCKDLRLGSFDQGLFSFLCFRSSGQRVRSDMEQKLHLSMIVIRSKPVKLVEQHRVTFRACLKSL